MLVFIHINKTAGRTVRYILRSSYGARHCEVETLPGPRGPEPFSSADLRRARRLYPNLASIAGHRVTGHADIDEDGTDLRYFTFLRDPVKLCASRFQYHVDYRGKKGLVFEEWLQREWLRNAQTKQIAGSADVSAAIDLIERKHIFVGLTERFDESMVMLKALRAPDLDIGYTPVNVARKNGIAAELLSDEPTRAAIAEANRADLLLYEHAVNVLYPELRAQYGPALDTDVASYTEDPHRAFNKRKLIGSRVKQYVLYKPYIRILRGTSGRVLQGAQL